MPLNLVHAVLQIAFDWHGYHLHVFETVCGEFGSPGEDYDSAERQDETTATLAQVAGAERAKAVYSYDFGDDWRHDIVVEKIIPAGPGVAYPRCTGGRRDGPPEDCGGIWVFNEQFAEFGDLFTVGDLNERLAGLAIKHGQRLPDHAGIAVLEQARYPRGQLDRQLLPLQGIERA